MPRRNVRVDIPFRSPDLMIKLVDALFKRHDALEDDSGLNDTEIDMVAFLTVHELHKEKRGEGIDNHALAEPLIQAADKALGTEEGQTIDTTGTFYNFTGRIRDRLLIVHNELDEEELTTYGFNVVVSESGGKRTVSVEIPISSPDDMIKLGKNILKRHTTLGDDSPLNIPEIDMTAFETVHNLHKEKREDGNDLHGKGEAAIQKADKALGTEEGQTSDTTGTVYNLTGTARDILLFKNPQEEEELTTYGFNVVISMTPLPGEDEPENFTGTIAAGTTANITEGGFDDTTNFLLSNTGAVALTFCRASAGDIACTEGVTVEQGEEATVVATDLGTGIWLNVTNAAEEQGSYVVTVNP